VLIAHVKTKISVVNNVIYFHASNNLKPLEKERKKTRFKTEAVERGLGIFCCRTGYKRDLYEKRDKILSIP